MDIVPSSSSTLATGSMLVGGTASTVPHCPFGSFNDPTSQMVATGTDQQWMTHSNRRQKKQAHISAV